MNQYDPTDLAGLEAARHEDEKKRHQDRKQEIDDLDWLMGTRPGRRFIWRLLARTGVYRSSFTGNSETFFREGERNIGLMLLLQINEHCPDRYAAMVKEQQSDRNADDGYRKQPPR